MSVTLSGTITVAGSPVDSATVSAYSAADATLIDSDTTGSDGAYSLSLAAGVVKLLVVAAGYPDTWYGTASSFAGASEIVLVADPVTADLALAVAPALGFSLGATTLLVGDFSGFATPPPGTLVRILTDGSSTDNEVIQSGSLGRRQATMTLPFVLDADLLTLRAAFEASTKASVVTPLETRTAIILDFASTSIVPGLWSVSLTLVAVPA